MFVDYKFTFDKDTHDIKFDDELNPQHLNIWDGKTYECEIIDGVVWFKYKEDWDMLHDPQDIPSLMEAVKNENKESRES